jgi:hypothetical protein
MSDVVRSSPLKLHTDNTIALDPQTQADDAEIFVPGTMSVFESIANGQADKANVHRFLSLVNKVTPFGSLAQLGIDVVIEQSSVEGDAEVCFKYEIANYGFKTLHSRSHRYWSNVPQSDFKIRAFSEDHKPLKLEMLETCGTFSEVRVFFPTELESSERQKYYVKYNVSKEFVESIFYDVVIRTITNRISFTLLSPPEKRFDVVKVVRDAADGTTPNPPLISLSIEEGNREKLFWQLRHPKPGDQFRTHWSFA